MIDVYKCVPRSLFASTIVGVGCYSYLLCNSSVTGSILLVTLLVVPFLLRLNLYTDKCGFVSDINDFRRLILVLLLNAIVVFLFGLAATWTSDNLTESANVIVLSRISGGIITIMLSSTITGLLTTLAVDSYDKTKNILISLLCVLPIAVLSLPHCMLDMFYYSASSETISNLGSVSIRLLLTVIFNFIGCNLYNLFIHRSLIYRDVL